MTQPETRLAALERQVKTSVEREARYSYAQLVQAVTLVRLESITWEDAVARVGPPQDVVGPGELTTVDVLQRFLSQREG